MCQTIDCLSKTVLSKKQIFLCFCDTLFSIEKSPFVLNCFIKSTNSLTIHHFVATKPVQDRTPRHILTINLSAPISTDMSVK